jgi:hypothetical protein
VEVILKFAKLYDGVDFNNEAQLLSYFDHFIKLEFMQFSKRKPLLNETIECLIQAYNLTPPNFVPPSDEVIQYVIDCVDRQIALDQKEDEIHCSTTLEFMRNEREVFSQEVMPLTVLSQVDAFLNEVVKVNDHNFC